MTPLVWMVLVSATGCGGDDEVRFPAVRCEDFAGSEHDADLDGHPNGQVELLREDDVRWLVDLECDNCPSVYNPDQTDLDGDGRGDACPRTDPGAGVWRGGGGCRCTGRPERGLSVLVFVALAWRAGARVRGTACRRRSGRP